jgi:hypothetical protein
VGKCWEVGGLGEVGEFTISPPIPNPVGDENTTEVNEALVYFWLD